MHFAPTPQELPNKKKKINGKAAGDRICLCTNPTSTQHKDRGKAPSYLKAKCKLNPSGWLLCSYLIIRA